MLLGKQLLQNKKFHLLLLVLNILTGIVTFLMFYKNPGKDAPTYLGLADGIISGSYSYWNFLEHPMPDTLRNPGYPLFLAFFRLFTHSIFCIQLSQLVLYFLSVKLVLSVLDILYNSMEIKNIFLLLLLPSIYVASYAPIIFPEIPVTFLIILIIWLDLKLNTPNWKKFALLGLLFGITFQIRPAIIFLPFLFVGYSYYRDHAKFSLSHAIVLLLIFFITMIPYGLWNKTNHGVFKVTSLEGGGGLLHLGYWSFKMPDYYDTRYWGNYCNREIIPFIDEKDKAGNIARYNAEWDIIDSICNPLLTINDSLMVQANKTNRSFLKTYNGAYTYKREELLKKFAIQNIKEDFPFYLKVKIYSAIRLWVTGLRMKDFEAASISKKAYLLYPLFITLIPFLAAITLIPLAFYRFRQNMKQSLWILIVLLYIGIIHIPFTIQARYTIPVRLELLMMLAVSVYFICFRKPGDPAGADNRP